MKILSERFTIIHRPTSAVVSILLFASLFLSSCMQSNTAKKTTLKSANSTNSKTPAKIPDFKEGSNFIQIGVDVFTSAVNFDVSFNDSIQLRGKDVDSYIRSSGTTTVACLTSRFSASTDLKIIVMAAIPRSVYNFSTQSLEYYYNIMPGDQSTNQSFCQKSGLINQLYNYYPTLVPKYKVGELCSVTCLSSTFTGQPLELYSSNGVGISQVATKQLILSLSNKPTSNLQTGVSCTQSSQCTAQGYDCCSLGQCVKDLALKPGVDTNSADYAQALSDILNSPINIYQYPQYYFICSTPVNQPTSPATPVNSTSEAIKRLKNLANLYSCTTKINGEYGVCTKTYTNASLNTAYSAGKDDRSFADTFTNTGIEKETLGSIEQISFGETVLYDYTLKTSTELKMNPFEDTYVKIEGNRNDNLSTGAAITIKAKPASAISNDLEIKYKIDASCVQLTTTLAKCEKHYTQGQENAGDTTELHRQGRPTDHYPSSNIFKLPYYANTSKNITVEVDGITVKTDQWQLNVASFSTIEFLPSTTLKVFPNQKVKITFFVDIPSYSYIMSSKLAAQTEIKQICSCADYTCKLTPVKNTSNAIVDYACVFPDPLPTEPPLSQKIYLSSKAVPVRFFDSNGVSQTKISGDTLAQEGKAFSYRKENLLNPNNRPDITLSNDTSDTYVGFNEIYGSITYANNSAKPAYEVNVKKGFTYDIYVAQGTFSNCVQCGNDYYSQLNKLFPLAQFGGGVTPMRTQTSRTVSNGTRSDEMAFGRACLLPAAMIPWSHATDSNVQDQRLNRMRAQHFLFANGYQYDWYGFDYGSVIGSFDGVKWFSIGTNRRIKAESNKMFIAINALFGDLTLESTYEVNINDSALNPTGSSMVTSDFDSDGAQCQRYYQCSTDTDCAASLGYDYACAPVGEITTSWPKFDDNAKEIPETQRDDNRLTSILGISNTGKRCVYRGRGAICGQNYNNVNPNITLFNQTTTSTFHGCSANTYCQNISTNGVKNPHFNNRIARYGKVRSDATVDSFGLGALIPGRPFAYNAEETIRSEALKNMNANKAFALCLPGRNVEANTYLAQHQTPPTGSNYNGDKILGIGMSVSKTIIDPVQNNYVMGCSIMDATNNYYHLNSSYATTSQSASTEIKYSAGTQAISTNALNAFNSIFSNKGITLGIYKNNTSVLTAPTFTENRCLRAPGASCFSDFECAPSKFIADKIKSISSSDTTVTAILNAYEVKFWQEELVCSQLYPKTNALYDPKNNRCCREVGKTISLPSGDDDNGLAMDQVPGIDMKMSEQTRYSRVATVYKDVKTNLLPKLAVAVKNQCSTGGCKNISTLTNQFKTISAFGERTSCTGDWIRNFANGTHKWEATRFQTINTSMFRCFNWLPRSSAASAEWSCAGLEADSPYCSSVQTSPFSAKAKAIMSYLARLELMGIPQIAIESEEFFNNSTEGDLSCRSNPTDLDAAYPSPNFTYPTQLFPTSLSVKEYTDGSTELYSAIDKDNFSGMKQIFKSDEIVGCYPAGTLMPTGSDPALCCTGMINSKTSLCQLNDYVDVSVYTNRYVSSEAKKLNATLFNQYGFVKDPSYVAQLACEKRMCASGVLAYGVLVSKLPVPGQENLENRFYRFLEGNSTADNKNGLLDLFNRGLKINTHAYCVPEGMRSINSDDLTVISCE